MVYILMPDCPMASAQYPFIIEANEYAKVHQVESKIVFPGKYYSNAEVDSFLRIHTFPFETLIDFSMKTCNELHVDVCPCVYILKGSKVVYHGAISNWAKSLAAKGSLKPENYALTALKTVLNSPDSVVKTISPVGCIVEY